MRVYPLGKSPEYVSSSFIFSPVENNRIWVMPEQGETFELNLETGAKTLLFNKFGHDFFKTPLGAGNVMADSIQTSLCWFFNRKGGLFRYDKTTREGLLFDLAGNYELAILCLLQTANEVWVGTSKGLWRYDRMSGQCRHVDNSPQIYIERMEMGYQGKLLTGRNYVYQSLNGCWEVSEENPEPVWADIPDHFDFLPASGASYAFTQNGDEVWACNPHYWVMNQQTANRATIYTSPFPAEPVAVRADNNHIFGLYRDTFLVVSRSFLADKLMGDQQIIAKWKRFGHLTDSLRPQDNDTWVIRKQKISFLKQQMQRETDKELLAGMHRQIMHFYDFRDDNKLEQMLSDSDVEDEVAGIIYERLLERQVRKGDFQKALQTFQTFKSRLPGDAFFEEGYKVQAWEQIVAAVGRFDSLDHAGLPPDALLWYKGNAMADLCVHCGYFEGEACFDLTLADSVYRLIVKKFPAGKYADDADFELISNSICNEGEDGSDHPEEVEDWARFIKKYPHSDKRPYAMMSMTWALGRTEADLRKGLSILDEVARLRPDWQAGAGEDGSRFVSIRREFQQQLDVFEMEVSVVLKKRKVRKGEPVELTFVLKNKGAKPKTARLVQMAGSPNFSVNIEQDAPDLSCVRPILFEENTGSVYPRNAADFKEIILKPGESYRETWDITRTALKFFEARVGHFTFDFPGKFRIWAKCENGMGTMNEPVLLEVE